MERLPDSILLHIFKFFNYETLCLAARVTCTRWWKITEDAELWRQVEVPEHFTNKRFVMLVKQIQDFVEDLDCTKCENITETGFLKLISLELPKLKRLGMPICPLEPNSSGDKLFSALAMICPNLEEVENLHANVFDSVDPYKCQSLFKNLKVLHDRPITTFGRIRNVAPKLDAEKRQKWKSGIHAISSFCADVVTYKCCRGIGYVDDDGLKYISQMFPSIQHLELRQCSVTDDGVSKFFQHNEVVGGLHEIMFDQPGEMTDRALHIIADHCPNIKHIKLSRMPHITNTGVRYLASKCKKLVELHLNNTAGFSEKENPKKQELDNTSLQAIAESCNNVTNFRLLYSKSVDHIGINSIVDGCKYLHGIMLFECPLVDDQVLQALQGLNFLKAMVVVNCSVTPKGIIDFILVAPTLLRLTLYSNNNAFFGDMTQLTDETFMKLECDDGNFRPNVISKLTLRGVGGDFLTLLTVLCPNVHTLDIRDAKEVNVASINTVMRNCESLKIFDISSVPLLDDTFITHLLCFSTCLRKLSLGNAIRHLDISALANVMASHPSLAMVSMDTYDAPVDEEQLLYLLKKSHNGKAFLHIDPESRRAHEARNFRFVEFHYTPLKYLGSVTQPTSLYVPVVDFPCEAPWRKKKEDDEDDIPTDEEQMPPLEEFDESVMDNAAVLHASGGGGNKEVESTVDRASESSSEDDNKADVSPQLKVWLGKKLKID